MNSENFVTFNSKSFWDVLKSHGQSGHHSESASFLTQMRLRILGSLELMQSQVPLHAST